MDVTNTIVSSTPTKAIMTNKYLLYTQYLSNVPKAIVPCLVPNHVTLYMLNRTLPPLYSQPQRLFNSYTTPLNTYTMCTHRLLNAFHAIAC